MALYNNYSDDGASCSGLLPGTTHGLSIYCACCVAQYYRTSVASSHTRFHAFWYLDCPLVNYLYQQTTDPNADRQEWAWPMQATCMIMLFLWLHQDHRRHIHQQSYFWAGHHAFALTCADNAYIRTEAGDSGLVDWVHRSNLIH